ncbi:hypothetical protein PpBr36_01806 [Pyricularia pennisetigena]|uniref:hypothetical protein n=1 Tax=Pyricularia pennisetigena TaxID=1578925 RepID=UPI00114DDEBD|nr:hypothetical protein PpBr36_01806 [Pyricularia pennisetigena]TLS28974.1 hypothetical protein PpBr36_01806 [Pyricularia pennisetigena]
MRGRIRTRDSSPSPSHVLRSSASTMTTTTSASSRAATPAATAAQAPPPPPKSSNCNSSSTDDDDNDYDAGRDVMAPPPRAALSGSAKPSASKTPSPNPQRNGSPGSSGRTPPPPPPPTRTSKATSPDNEQQQQQQQQLLREKDQRIAALERELDSLSHNESERAAFWQLQHSNLHQQFLRTDTELRLLRAEVDLRATERDGLRQDWDAARRDLAARESEIVDLRGQVRGLKEWLANSTRSVYGGGSGDVPADDVFADGFSRLYNGLQNWIISNFRRTKLDLSRADADILEELSSLVPTYGELAKDAKLPLLQSLVSKILVEMIFDSYFVGLSNDQAKQFSQMEALMVSFVEDPELANQWRASTLTLLSRNASQKLQEGTANTTNAVITRIYRLLSGIIADQPTTTTTTAAAAAAAQNTALRGPSPAPLDPAAREASLRQLITTAIDLARQLSVQRALFRVFLPTASAANADLQTTFNPSRMEDVGGLLDEDALAAGPAVRCAMFPGVVKRGDENGGNLQQYENVISKARVLCYHPED